MRREVSSTSERNRLIWGAIVNASRSWGVMARDYVTDRSVATGTSEAEVDAERRVLYHRHFAWLTALRYALRELRAWEAIQLPPNAEFRDRWFAVEETPQGVGAALLPYLDPAEISYGLHVSGPSSASSHSEPRSLSSAVSVGGVRARTATADRRDNAMAVIACQ